MPKIILAVIYASFYSFTMDLFAASSESNLIKYGPSKVYKTIIHKPKLLATLPAANKDPFLVFSGVDCLECDVNPAIYINSATQSISSSDEFPPRYTYPGLYHDNLSQKLVEKVRMFVGQCTPNKKWGVVWFHHSKIESGKWYRKTFLIQVEGVKLVKNWKPSREVTLKVAQFAVSRGSCQEIAGNHFITEP